MVTESVPANLLSIVICTYQREDLLLECIASLLKYSGEYDWQLVVVNNSEQKFSSKTTTFLSSIPNAIFLHEEKPGLSTARNLAIQNVNTKWIGFIDDDARITSNYFEAVVRNIRSNDFECFGGHIISWWKYKRPRWLAVDYGSKPKLTPVRKEISEGYNWGSNIFFQRSSLLEVGLFPEAIGMKGKKIGYAAENVVQMKMRNAGMTIGYDPDIVVEHIVLPIKLKILWHLSAAYATGRDGMSIFPEQYTLYGWLKSFKQVLVQPIRAVYHFFFVNDYYWENVLIDSAKPLFLLFGKTKALLFSSPGK